MITLETFKRGTIALALASAFAFASNASATSVANLDTEDLAHIADAVVVGEVQGVRMAHESVSAGTAPTYRTHNAIKVVETWKGTAKSGDILDVVDIGGVVNGEGFDIEGMPGYKVGERVVLFLHRIKFAADQWDTIGFFLGKYSLLPNTQGGWVLTRLNWKLAERGQRLDLRSIPAIKLNVGSEDFASFSSKVKNVVAADNAAGIEGKRLPKYEYLGVGR